MSETHLQLVVGGSGGLRTSVARFSTAYSTRRTRAFAYYLPPMEMADVLTNPQPASRIYRINDVSQTKLIKTAKSFLLVLMRSL